MASGYAYEIGNRRLIRGKRFFLLSQHAALWYSTFHVIQDPLIRKARGNTTPDQHDDFPDDKRLSSILNAILNALQLNFQWLLSLQPDAVGFLR